MNAPAKVETVETSLVRWLKLQGIGKKPTTLSYHQEIARIIRDRWPDMRTPLAEVTDDQLVKFAESIAHFSTPRYNGCVNALRKMMPAAIIVPRRKYVAPERHMPTPEQYNRLLTALDCSYKGHSGLVVRFLAFTGLRINEARQIRWEHVRDEHIYAPANVTKNGKPRCIPFIPGMADVLRALRGASPERRMAKSRAGFVLPQSHIPSKTFLYACRLAGIHRVCHHTFRHFYATQCILSGVDIPTVAKWLGHSDNGVLLLRTYCHLLDDHSMEMAKRVKLGGLPVPATKEAANVVPLYPPSSGHSPAPAPETARAAADSESVCAGATVSG